MAKKPGRFARAIEELLIDGRPHDREEILALCPGARLANARKAISQCRKHIDERGLEIAIQFIRGKLHYRMLRRINNNE